ncbi:MAG: hypothetical protein AAF995_01725 [Planctomycetota bacterium]
MAFATDRDVLALEPRVFEEAGWAAQRLVSGVGSVSGTALTLESGGPGFDAAGVDAGAVVVVDGVALEVVARVSASVLTVSRLRAEAGDAPIAPAGVVSKAVEVPTLGPQLAIAHRQVLSMAGVEVAGQAWLAEDAVTDAAVTDAAVVGAPGCVLAEVLGALHLAYAALASAGAAGEAYAVKAACYRERFGAARRRAELVLDLDGDGIGDARRKLNAVRLSRG